MFITLKICQLSLFSFSHIQMCYLRYEAHALYADFFLILLCLNATIFEQFIVLRIIYIIVINDQCQVAQ